MSSQVISYRLSTDEVLSLRQKALPGESDNQTAQRLMREALGVSTVYTKAATMSTNSLDERIESIVEEKLSSFAANQNDLLSRLQERLQQVESCLEEMSATVKSQVSQIPTDKVDIDKVTDTTVDVVDITVDSMEHPLTQSELSKRLGVHTGTLTKNRSKPNFAEWSRAKDPEQLAWKYLSEVERYTPMSTPSSTVSTDNPNESNLSDWEARVDAAVGQL